MSPLTTMAYDPNLLFVYGTLHPDRAPAEIADVVSLFVFVGPGTVHGRVHRFPHYPALQLDAAGIPIPGVIFRVPAHAWPALDVYEGFLPRDLAASLFHREQAIVTQPDGAQLRCWIYTYAHPFPNNPTCL